MRSAAWTVGLVFAAWVALPATASEFAIVADGRSAVTVYAPGENQWAGLRFADRIQRLTGVEVVLQTATALPVGDGAVVAVGTPTSNAVVATVAGDDDRIAGLGEQGYMIKVGIWQDRRVLAATGATLEGVNNGVSEIISWKLKLSDGGASVPGDLDETDRPALKYRLLWNWDSRTNWETSVERMHAVPFQRWNLNEQGAAGHETHIKRAIDYFADHKLNGLTIWGYIRPDHGGLETARRLCTYAKRNNVRMLPGVCPEAAYGGFTFDKEAEYNLDNWTEKHPELRYKDAKGTLHPGACPSKPQNQQWLKRGTKWFFDQLPDVGGANIENGDWFYCWTDDCVEAKSRPENDPNFFWDQMASYKPVLEVSAEIRPDAWMVFATYSGFTENAIGGAMYGATATGRAVGIATEVVYPPRMMAQIPANGICQWTLTGMVTPEAWPEGARPPESNFEDHIGYILQAGAVWPPSNPDRWWAGLPGSRWEEISEMIQFLCSRMHKADMKGLVMYGERGPASPCNELNYLALEYFGWHPDRSFDQFTNDRLAYCYGGQDRARLFLELLRNTSRNPAQIEDDRRKAAEVASRADLDVRQRARWNNLGDELARRVKVAGQLPAE